MEDLKLCQSCTKLDIASRFRVEFIADFDYDDPETWSIKEYEIAASDGTAECALCRFWLDMRARTGATPQQPGNARDSSIKFSLVSFPVSEAYQLHEHTRPQAEPTASIELNDDHLGKVNKKEEDDDEADSVILLYVNGFDRLQTATVGHELFKIASTYYGAIALCAPTTGARSDTFAGQVVPANKVDWDIMRRSIRICSDYHRCHTFQSSEQAPHLKLIDCQSRSIVHAAPGDRFVALSYVWGKDTAEIVEASQVYPSLPLSLPRVVEDSITAVVELGLRYLWVDRYCIWQGDAVHKPAQIARMDLIYRNAELTLVAVAGSDPEHGLPGVGTTPRMRQPNVTIDSATSLVCLMQLPMKATADSKWNTRAWTYQEAYLSPRRLYFTDEQIYYECQEMIAMESISCPLQFMTLVGDPASKPQYPCSDMDRPAGIVALINRYSSRQLTYDGDGLNAISALLGEWAARNEFCYIFHGLPLIDYTSSGNVQDGLDAAFVRALKWMSDVGEDNDDVPRPKSTRRDNFPTWSWVSTVGKVSYWRGLEAPRESPSYPCRVWVEAKSGLLQPLVTALKHPSDTNSNGCIHLEGYVVEAGPFTKVTRMSPWGTSTSKYTYTLTNNLTGSSSSFTFHADLDPRDAIYEFIDKRSYDCLVLDSATLMVLVYTSDAYQRVGLLKRDRHSDVGIFKSNKPRTMRLR
ncbi:hypothetical protein PG996_012363 [Apiospora saccharicola]|uniref:Heterokaryon incompatibility domain-containing protein n=1 Tax=Apiospora saccharicola TaxID=335842 RepID=A0ABR1U2Y3_9PEZI